MDMPTSPVCDSGAMNLLKKAASFAYDGIFVTLGWLIVGMFVLSTVIALLGGIGLLFHL
jgi:hypothetical protein